MADAIGRELVAQTPRARHEVSAAGQNRFDHALELAGVILAVGIDSRNHLRTPRASQPIAEPQCRTLAAVDGNVAYQSARPPGLLGGLVARAVYDHNDLRPEPSGHFRNLPDDRPDGGFLVVCGNHNRNRSARARWMIRQKASRCSPF